MPPAPNCCRFLPKSSRRAARTAALFTEEELTRFLCKSCCEPSTSSGYRQEQRFHFELGLLKLVHLRRLLPVEEVLPSSLERRSKPGTAHKARLPRSRRQSVSSLASDSRCSKAPATERPGQARLFSPFEQNQANRRRYDGIWHCAVVPAAQLPLRRRLSAPGSLTSASLKLCPRISAGGMRLQLLGSERRAGCQPRHRSMPIETTPAVPVARARSSDSVPVRLP